MLFSTMTTRLLRSTSYSQLIVKRFKGRRRDHSSKLKKGPTDHALEHFDNFYEPVFGSKWPSIRLALLSSQKYCALVNNFANSEETIMNLISIGTDDILTISRETQPAEPRQSDIGRTNEIQVNNDCDDEETIKEATETDIYTFMPTKKIGSAVERLKEEERQMHEERTMDIDAPVINDNALNFPTHLKAFAFKRGNASLFTAPSRDSSNKTDYYLYDAASLLPVLALDLVPDCSVLDLCAAPGGKMLTMLQTNLPANLTCVDCSSSRLTRLNWILQQYMPDSGIVEAVCKDAVPFCIENGINAPYDRVLVDVPCSTDRHALADPDNNIFRTSRLSERVKLPHRQKQLLFHGIQACKPEGSIVYSTCTLSPVQNDGVIQATLEQLWQDTKIDVAVVDIRHMAERFRVTYDIVNTRFGQLVLPNVTANFGPMYFCKLKRLN